MSAPACSYGFESDRLTPGQRRGAFRWWVYLELPAARNRKARQGVSDAGFRFARGGRADSAGEADAAVQAAFEEARIEIATWRHQPSHMLGPAGELVPLGLIPELEPTAGGS